MLTTAIDKVQGLLSRGFLLGAFFPVLIFVALNAVVAYCGLTDRRTSFAALKKEWWPTDVSDQAFLTAAILVTIGVVAYVLSALVDLFRSFLEGRFLGPRLRENLMTAVRADFSQKWRDSGSAQRDWDDLMKFRDAQVQQLDDSIAAGNAAGGAGNPGAVDTAETDLRNAQGKVPGAGDHRIQLETALLSVNAALQANRTASTAAAPLTAAQLAISERLDQLNRDIRNEIDRLVAAGKRRFDAAWASVHGNYVPDDLRPTRLGNIRAVIESYSEKSYGVRFDYIWPRLQLFVLKDDKFSATVEYAKAQLDFSLLMLCLATVTVVLWLPALTIWGTSMWTVIALGALGPATVYFFYLLVQESQIVFSAIVQSSIDMYRMDVLARLRQYLPMGLSYERRLWDDLQKVPDAAGSIELRYSHPKP